MSTKSISAAHETKAVRGPIIPGTWLPACTCGWVGEKEYGRGARDRAREAGYDHEIDMEEAAEQAAAKERHPAGKAFVRTRDEWASLLFRKAAAVDREIARINDDYSGWPDDDEADYVVKQLEREWRDLLTEYTAAVKAGDVA